MGRTGCQCRKWWLCCSYFASSCIRSRQDLQRETWKGSQNGLEHVHLCGRNFYVSQELGKAWAGCLSWCRLVTAPHARSWARLLHCGLLPNHGNPAPKPPVACLTAPQLPMPAGRLGEAVGDKLTAGALGPVGSWRNGASTFYSLTSKFPSKFSKRKGRLSNTCKGKTL